MVLCLKARESRSLPGLPASWEQTGRTSVRPGLQIQICGIWVRPGPCAPGGHEADTDFVDGHRLGEVHPGLSEIGAGWSSPVARQAHNLKVAGSNPAPATNSILFEYIDLGPPRRS